MSTETITITATINTRAAKWKNEPMNASNDTTVLCHHNSISGITNAYTRYPTISMPNSAITKISPPLSDLLLWLKETPRFYICPELFNCFPAKAHRDSPASMAAEWRQSDTLREKLERQKQEVTQ
jgi:hypothetical protein